MQDGRKGMKNSWWDEDEEKRKLHSKVKNPIKLKEEMCVYLYLLVYSCLSEYTGVTVRVMRRGKQGGGNYITCLPWLLMQFPSMPFSHLHV